MPKRLSCPRDLRLSFVNFLRYRNASDYCCNMVYVYVCKIYEKFGGYLWSFSWLGQKVKDHADKVDYATSFCLMA